MTRQELFEGIYETLTPIIMADEDIIGCIKRNQFNEEETKLFIGWLVNASICVMFSDSTDATMKELIEACQHDMQLYERGLTKAGYGDDVGSVLREILEENIQEWFEIIRKAIKKVEDEKPAARGARRGTRTRKAEHIEDENASGKIQDSKEFAALKLHTYFLREVVLREDDTIEFLDKYSHVDRDQLIAYVTFNVFYCYLMKIKKGDITPPKDNILVTHLSKLLKLNEKVLQEIAKSALEDKIEDADQFNEDMKEILDDHFNEFIKKMFKNLFKAANEAGNK